MDSDMDLEQGTSADALAIFQEAYDAQQRPPTLEHDRKMLDLVFVQDCTGSQGSYISSATKNIQLICDNICQSGKLQAREDLRVGLVAYRDHPPQDHTYVTRNFGFSSDIDKVHRDLSSLYASGGGDGPEAMIVLIADAPPHGVGEYGDGEFIPFVSTTGSPDGNDPLVLARQMAARGITLFFVACEPALSSYSFATDFFKALVNITSGIMLPLTTADLLAHAIVGLVLENLDMERLVREVGQAVAHRILGNNESVDDVARELHEKLLLRNESTKKVVIESIYRDSEEARHNVEVFSRSSNLAEARPHLRKINGTRFTDKYMQVRMLGARGSYGYSPAFPPRPSDSRAPISSGFAASSPPRKVVTDFAAFGTSKTPSVYNTAVQSTPFSLAGNQAAFGSMRTTTQNTIYDDDDDEEEAAATGRETEGARRIAMQSAWRGSRG
ncbi:elongation factor-2 kinase [Russula earlei]|uniref:Elongation factor-2 kinase n=1 Tax=Russula earlei TaxID=71964 RepID=A0ACC0UFV8_9AGAM|nr:elongation factor-2 kinase [Russula earlei]